MKNLNQEVGKLEKQGTHPDVTNEDTKSITEKIKDIHIDILNLMDEDEKRKEVKLIKELTSNPKAFYKYANEKKKTKTKIGPLKSGNSYESDPKRMAEILSKQYENVFSIPMDDIQHHISKIKPSIKLTDIDMTKDNIINAIKDIKNDSAPGPDGIPVSFYKDYAEELAGPILMLWRYSLDNSEQLEEPIFAVITPLHKGGPKCFAVNYRPVALTNHLNKIFERVLRKKIVLYLEENNLMNETQHGFRTGRSTITQLLNYYDSIMTMLEEGCSVDSIYLDFSKAFDKVDHNILLAKITNLGIGGKIHAWIATFLKHRHQSVRVEGYLSEKVWVKSGVPQGSVLGPLLFLIMMYDINKNIIDSTLSSFADDTRLWRKIRNLQEANELQNDLSKLYEWAQINNMDFNPEKFEGMSYGLDEEQSYKAPDSTTIKQLNVVKDLGIYMAEDMQFKQHIRNIVAKGQRMVGWILRTIKSRNAQHMKTFLKTLVISQMEYCSILWSPSDQVSINLLESVQAKFTRRISSYQEYDDTLKMPVCIKAYTERLADLKIYSLERRRERRQIQYIYKIIIGLLPNPGFSWNYNIRTKYRIEPKINKKQGWISRVRNSSFSVKGPLLFNSLHPQLRELEDTTKSKLQNVSIFKRKLDKYLKEIPDIPGRANSILHHSNIHYT